MRSVLQTVVNPLKNLLKYARMRKYRSERKIIYAITPPPELRNVGDHAQVVAIKKWFNDYFKNYTILEFDKNDVYTYIHTIKKITNEDDLIFLHSGGNLGDRGLWSENARRKIIENFPRNKIISLPQTIFFSDTNKGMDELEVSKKIYNFHRDLTIIGRDPYSYSLAKKYFPKCKILSCPDFVLYLAPAYSEKTDNSREGILLCLRNDSESVVDENIRSKLFESIGLLGENCTEYDTTVDHDILYNDRIKDLENALSLFKKNKLVITDRFHGVIFSVITKTPCIALKTVDHKLTESVKWFENLNYVFYVEDLSELPETIEKAINVDSFYSEDWNKLYFNSLKKRIFDE